MLFKRPNSANPKCKTFTLMLIPGKYGSPKTLHIPRWAIKSIIYFNIIALILIGIFVLNYKTLRSSYREYLQNNEQLKIMNEAQENEITELKKSADDIKSKLEELKSLEEKLKTKLNLNSTNSKESPVTQVTYLSASIDLSKDIDSQIKSINNVLIAADKKIAAINSKPSILPSRGSITSYFGMRRNPFGGRGYEFHEGVDISASHGSEIIASGDGVVEYSGWKSGYGNVVFINHGYGYVTVYAHNSKLLVKEGHKVKKGQAISLMGSTGRSTGTHVHFEIRINSVPINPLKIINGGV